MPRPSRLHFSAVVATLTMRHFRLFALTFVLLMFTLAASVLPLAAQIGFVINQSGGYVTFVDGSTDGIAGGLLNSVIVGFSPLYVVFSPDGTSAYVTNRGRPTDLYGTVSVINALPGLTSVTGTIPVGKYPEGIAITPDGKQVYVMNIIDSTVSVINTSTNTVSATIPIPGLIGYEMVTSPVSTKAYVSAYCTSGPNVGACEVVIDTTTNTVSGTLPGLASGETSYGMAITPDGKRLYLANGVSVDDNNNYNGSNTVGVIDIASSTQIATISVTPEPFDIAISPDGTKAYVAGADPNYPNGTYGVLSVIDTASNTVSAVIFDSNARLWTPAVTPDGLKVFATNEQFGYYGVDVFNAVTNTLEAKITNTSLYPTEFVNPVGIAFQPLSESVPFATFGAKLSIVKTSLTPGFSLNSGFTLGSNNAPIFPLTSPVKLTVGNYFVSVPATSFKPLTHGSKTGAYVFSGTINGVSVVEQLTPTGTNSYSFSATATPVTPATSNPVSVTLTIGNNSSTASVNAKIQ
jgi:YVTN family beta-propeller protein